VISFFKKFYGYRFIFFVIILVIVVTTFVLDPDCLIGGCYHGIAGERICHVEKNLLNSSNSFDYSQICDNGSLSIAGISLVLDMTSKPLLYAEPLKPLNTSALSIKSSRAPPCPAS